MTCKVMAVYEVGGTEFPILIELDAALDAVSGDHCGGGAGSGMGMRDSDWDYVHREEADKACERMAAVLNEWIGRGDIADGSVTVHEEDE